MDRFTLASIAAVGAGALVVYAVFRSLSSTALDAVRAEAKVEATNEMLTGAAELAGAANEVLAQASDPGTGSVDDTLAGAKL
jgi:hypothetical protein